MRATLRKLIGEPLFHFLLLGAVIFHCWAVAQHRCRSGEKIVVTQSQIRASSSVSAVRGCALLQEEMQGWSTTTFARKCSYREAKAMGLDQDDIIVRRRMRQKFEF